MSTLDRAILNHELLSSEMTRRWLKPRARTADPTFPVGAPWEIFTLSQNRMIDVYTKSGDIGSYSAMMGLSQDHDVGFTIMVAGQATTASNWAIGDLVTTIIIPGLEEAAKEEAQVRFGGRYISDNSSLTLTTDDGLGLKITEWQSNGQNMLETLTILLAGELVEGIDIRLYPTGLKSRGRISFRSIVSSLPSHVGPPNGPLTSACNSWLVVDNPVYGSVAVDEFVFDLSAGGDAIRVSPRVLRKSLQKVGH